MDRNFQVFFLLPTSISVYDQGECVPAIASDVIAHNGGTSWKSLQLFYKINFNAIIDEWHQFFTIPEQIQTYTVSPGPIHIHNKYVKVCYFDDAIRF